MTKEKNQNKAYPEELPKFTWYPFILSIGVTLLFWGIVTTLIIAIMGIIFLFLGLIGWISNLLEEQKRMENGEKEM
ncbi:hypothetical protein [Aureivirga marina]|uniref:hypothetical protein n=1 Tax=Aureivirga marina TaxID=1182451 RepID=UPI0018C9E29B|nr:hypothetical protein [Aureivirga marina]